MRTLRLGFSLRERIPEREKGRKGERERERKRAACPAFVQRDDADGAFTPVYSGYVPGTGSN